MKATLVLCIAICAVYCTVAQSTVDTLPYRGSIADLRTHRHLRNRKPPTPPAPPKPTPPTPAKPTPTPRPTTSKPTSLADLLKYILAILAKFKASVDGDAAKVPPPVVKDSLVVYKTANVSSTIGVENDNDTIIDTTTSIRCATVSLNVTYLPQPATLVVFLTDENNVTVGNVTTHVTAAGLVNVTLTEVLNSLKNTYQQGYSIRYIRGNILRISVGVATEDVPVNIDPAVMTSVILTQSNPDSPDDTLSPDTTSEPSTVEPTTAEPSTEAPTTISTLAPRDINSASSTVYSSLILVLGLILLSM